MSEWKVKVGVDVDASGVQQQLSNLSLKPIDVDVRLSDASVKNIQSNIANATAKSGANAAKSFSSAFAKAKVDFSSIDKQLSAIENRKNTINLLSPGDAKSSQTFSRLKSELTQISKLMKDVSKLDFDKNSSEIGVVTSRMKELISSYISTLSKISSGLAPGQVNELNEIIKNTSFELDKISAKTKDAFNLKNAKAEIAQTKSDANELVRILNEKAKINIDMSSLDQASNKTKELQARLEYLDSKERAILSRSSSNFTSSQLEKITEAKASAASRVSIAKAGDIDKANRLQAAAEAKAQVEQTKISVTQLKDVIRQIGNTKVKLAGLDESSSEAKKLTSELTALEAKAKEMALSVGDVTKTQANSLVSSWDKMEQRVSNVMDSYNKKLSDGASKIRDNDFVEKYSKQIESIRQKVSRKEMDGSLFEGEFKQSLAEAEHHYEQLGRARANLFKAESSGDLKEQVAARKQLVDVEYNLQNSLKRTQNLYAMNTEKIATATKSQKQFEEEQTLALRKANFSSQIDLWKKNHSAVIGTEFETQLDNIKSKIGEINSTGSLNNLKQEFSGVTTQAQLADKATLSLWDRTKNQIKQYSTYFGVAGAMMLGTKAARSMYDQTLQIDTAMTELKRVTDLSDTGYANLFSDMTASAKEYGVALSDVISATADWSRAGFDAETAKGLAEVTTMYQHVSDLDYDEASQNLLTSYKGFEKQLKQTYGDDAVSAVGYIGDILNELDNNYAVTAAGVGEGLKRAASSLDVANNTIQESAAMVAGTAEVTQDPEKAGNALKVVSMRIRGMKGELEELGEETDGDIENISKMQGQILNLTHGHTNIFDSKGDFKSTYEIKLLSPYNESYMLYCA